VTAGHLPPELASEVSARLHAFGPAMQYLLRENDPDLERLLAAVWLHGYGSGAGEALEALDGNESAIFTWASRRRT
jgi:hypothetical protein